MKLTIADIVLDYLYYYRGVPVDAYIIAKNTGLNYNSVRSVLSGLYNVGQVNRPSRGLYVYGSPIIYRHYVSALAYCSNKNTPFYGLTFDTVDDDKEIEILAEIDKEITDYCGNTRQTGYQVSETSRGKNSSNTYPSIEVGEL